MASHQHLNNVPKCFSCILPHFAIVFAGGRLSGCLPIGFAGCLFYRTVVFDNAKGMVLLHGINSSCMKFCFVCSGPGSSTTTYSTFNTLNIMFNRTVQCKQHALMYAFVALVSSIRYCSLSEHHYLYLCINLFHGFDM